jgi:hypothetical protein
MFISMNVAYGNMSANINLIRNTCKSIQIHTCTYGYRNIWKYICVCVCLSVCLFERVCVFECVCI